MNWNSDWTESFPIVLGLGISIGLLVGVIGMICLFQLY